MIDTEPIKAVIDRLHLEHGVGGDSLRCIECVVAGLNEIEAEAAAVTRRRLGGE